MDVDGCNGVHKYIGTNDPYKKGFNHKLGHVSVKEGQACKGCARKWNGGWAGPGDSGYTYTNAKGEIRASMINSEFCEACKPCSM